MHSNLFVYFLWFSLLFIFIHMYIYAFIHLHINFLKPSRCLNSTRDFWSSVFWAESWRPSRPNFPKLFIYFLMPKIWTKTRANLFSCPLSITRAVRTYWQDCMYVCMYVWMKKKKLTRWLSTDVFHSWSLQYAFDPATTSSVVYGVYGGTEWGLEIRLCVLTSTNVH